MWGNSEEPPGTMEAGPPETVANLQETYEQNKTQLESVKEIMLRNKQSLKKKEEELQEYAKKLSKFKTRAKRSHKDDAASSNESTPKSKSDTTEPSDDVVDDISQAKTPKAKSSLLQKKLAEDRKIFEQRSKELTESKRAVEEKVEQLRQQLEENYAAPVSIVTPMLVTSQAALPLLELSQAQDKDNKIAELSNKILELEATIIDLQDSLKEKDSVIDSKTKAVTLMSADLSMKGKTTLDTLEDTKDEMRAMQENFVLVETSLRTKNDHLLQQLEEKTDVISKLEVTVQSLTDQMEAQKQAGTACADLSRSTMDTLADTKDEMRAMQENFVLMESSLKAKNEHLLKQLEEREMKLAEAEARILSLESGIGIEKPPNADDLIYKIEKLEAANRALEDEKFELQKSNTVLQEKIISVQSSASDNVIAEKDNRITELETLVAELKKASVAIEEACKAEMQKQIDELNGKNEELASKVIELEKQVRDMESEKLEFVTKLSASENDASKEQVQKLTKELDELNKSMIKLKAQHKAKLKNSQKQLENFKKVSDTNAELVKLGNQVAVLEEEKGNLQLSLVDFDELKAAAGDLQARVNDLEGKVSAQAKEIQAHIEAIAILENQKLDLMQELHAVKQEVSSLEAENAELENARVTAEMKLIELEDEHENRAEEVVADDEKLELQRQMETLKEENERLSQKISKLEELKSSSEVGSTESFVKTGSNVDSTESFEALAADADKADLLKKIDSLMRENGALLEKLTRYEEKGSSDAGSTESFEKIPEHGDSSASKVDMLTRENYELVVKLTKLEELVASGLTPVVSAETNDRFGLLSQENERLISEVNELHEQLSHLVREKRSIEDQSVVPLAIEYEQDTEVALTQSEEDAATTVSSDTVKDVINVDELVTKIEGLTALNDNLTSSLLELQQAREDLQKEKQEFTAAMLEEKSSAEEKKAVADQLHEVEQPIVPEETVTVESSVQLSAHVADEKITAAESEVIASLEAEIERCNALIAEQTSVIEDMKIKLAEKEKDLNDKSTQLATHNEVAELNVQSLQKELEESASVIAEWKLKCSDMEAKIETLEHSRKHIDEGFQALQEENKNLIQQSEHKEALVTSLREELDSALNNFEIKMKDRSEVIASQEELINELRRSLENKDHELQAKYTQLQSDLIKIDELQEQLNKFQGQVQQRDTTITSLTEEVENLRTNTSLIEEDLFAARHVLSDLQEKLENSKSLDEYNQAVEKLNEKETLVEELESKVSQKIAEASSLRNQAESLASENEQLRVQLQEEERKVTELMEGNQGQEEAVQNAERAKAEIENRLLNLQAMHDENLKHANNITTELQDAYRMLEQLKFKHTEDMEMLNRRLEDVIEELHSKSQELISIQGELDEKNSILVKSVPEEVKINLEGQVTEMEKKLTEAEEKMQTQLEKMKKYAAVAKKKSAQCEELESKIKELEEQLNLEKNEKDAINKQLQESLSQVQEKDNKVTELEQELQRVQAERDEALINLESLKAELSKTHEKLNVLDEEIKTLSEAKDNARELGVRMQVMESEYMEQLAQINSLKAENGFLQSKQTQINERLENVEKESEERRKKLEKMEKEKEIAETERTEACQEMCGQCATKVQALESKLQERDAEIENLDNELHNSIDNLVQMQENLRLSTLAAQPDSAIQTSYNELLTQYNVLSATNEEMKNRHETTLRENEDLAERIAKLQELNATMHERIDAVERELTKDKESVASYDILNQQYSEIVEKFNSQRTELETIQTKLQEVKAASESSEHNLKSQIELLEKEKQSLVQEYENLKSVKEKVAPDDGWGFDASQDLIEVEAHQQLTEEPVTETVERQKREVDEATLVKEESPPLFDASVFGVPLLPTQNVNAELELEVGNLREQVNSLSIQLQNSKVIEEEIRAQLDHQVQQARVTIEYLKEELRNMNASKSELESILGSRDGDMMALRDSVSSANHALDTVKTDYENLSTVLEEKNAMIENIKSERSEYLSHLEQLSHEKQEVQRAVDHLLSNLAIVDNSSSVVGKLLNLQSKIDTFLSELESVKSDNQQLSAAQEVYKNRALELEKEVKTTSDSARIAELENRIARVVSERDILQLQYNDVSRAFEDLKYSTDGMRNIQAQLESVSRERDELVKQLQALKSSQPVVQQEPVQEQIQQSEQLAEVAAVLPKKVEDPTDESMWEDDEDPWGHNIPHAVEEHQHIPIVPSAEIQLKIKVDELEDKLKKLIDENAKLIEEGKLAQIKNVKYVKKLKEYKAQYDSLQRQLKSQQSFGGFGDLDSAIEEELKSQVESLEKALAEAKEETKKVTAEKENLLKRIDVLTAATERFTEAKEKQDTEVHIWQMRYKELEMKLQQLDFGPETKDSSSSPPQETVQVNSQYEEELKELRDNVDALATENEELQHLLEEHRAKRQASIDESAIQVQELQAKNSELSASNDKLKNDYDHLRKQFEQSLMDANDQVQNMRQNCEIMKSELIDKSAESEKLVAELQEQLHATIEAKTQLEVRVQSLESDVGKLNSTATSLDEFTELLNARVQEVANLKEELLQQQVEKSQLLETSSATEQQLMDALNYKQSQLDQLHSVLAEKDTEISRLTAELAELKGVVEKVKGLELSIEGYVTEVQEKNEEIRTLKEKIHDYETSLSDKEHILSTQQSQLQQSASEIQQCTTQVQEQQDVGQQLIEAKHQIDQLTNVVAEKEEALERNNDEVRRLLVELQSKQTEAEELKNKLEAAVQEPIVQKELTVDFGTEKKVVEDIPVFTFGSDNNDEELQHLRNQLKAKNEEIEHLQYSLNEGSLTKLIQDLQDDINTLYNEKDDLEGQIIARNQEIAALKTQLEETHYNQPRKRSLGEQEELMKLQNELHERDQQMNELKYIVAEKESQLKAALHQASSDYEQQDSVERLRSELYEKQQELESLKFTVSELQSEVASLRGLERLADEDRATIERLNSEKEEVRSQAEEAVERILKEKESEMDAIKHQLLTENQNLLEALGLRERDLENLKIQIEQTGFDKDGLLQQRTEQLATLEAEVSERDRRLAELSITKDAEIHNLRVQLSEKTSRLEELMALSEEEERQLAEMRKIVEVKEQQINGLTQQLDEKTKEYDLIQHALQRRVDNSDQSTEVQQQLQQSASQVADPSTSDSSNELDLALYMLHQRDVRCEELTQELMQLLEERDTLQLRLSNAIRVNEELRRYAATASGSSPQKDTIAHQGSSDSSDAAAAAQPLIENPSPSKSEGPVEIAKEAINSPIGEDKKALAQKLSQLRSVNQGKDVRLKDERELRHTQMTLLAHKEALSKLPPEAAAKLVNANYTLSRDVQSQSSVLMNWLWGKSTPKVVHM